MFRTADASCETLADTGPRRLGETRGVHVGTKGAQKLCLIQLRGMKLPGGSPRFSLNNHGVSCGAQAAPFLRTVNSSTRAAGAAGGGLAVTSPVCNRFSRCRHEICILFLLLLLLSSFLKRKPQRTLNCVCVLAT